MWTSLVLGAISGVSGIVVAYESEGVITGAGLTWWQMLLIVTVPTLLGFILDLAVNKGWITKDQAQKLKDSGKTVIDDLADDGKINNSNKGKK